MKVKDIKFEEFTYLNGALKTMRHYNNGKIIATMQLSCITKDCINNTPIFNVIIDYRECLPNNRYGKILGHQSANVDSQGRRLEKWNIDKFDTRNFAYPNEKNTIDNKFITWIQSAIKLLIELDTNRFYSDPV